MMIKIGLVQINNSYSTGAGGGTHYLPYSTGLLQAYAQANLREPDAFEFLPMQFRRKPIRDSVADLENADLIGFSWTPASTIRFWRFSDDFGVETDWRRRFSCDALDLAPNGH